MDHKPIGTTRWSREHRSKELLMNAHDAHSAAARARRRLVRTGVGVGIAAAAFSTAAVATAAPSHAARPTAISATAKPYSSVTVSPRTVRPGQRVTISGNAPKNARAGLWITLESDAFASKASVNGIPAIRTQVLVNGKYSVGATIRSGLKATTYAISGTFNSKPLDTVAWVTVR
jgi:hypothetical protein